MGTYFFYIPTLLRIWIRIILGSWIRIRIKVKSWIRICINVKPEKLQILKIEPIWTLTIEVCRLTLMRSRIRAPCLGIMDPDPAIFVIDLKDVN